MIKCEHCQYYFTSPLSEPCIKCDDNSSNFLLDKNYVPGPDSCPECTYSFCHDSDWGHYTGCAQA